ncbi:hypothetical protein DSCO28_33110 [Desulfosarcina ovata subsp. sediminis]|uniref:Glycosyltransferase 2-like domain-containing protein n=1 Tax=Desulfosarcina ovata subsp. sediminis TaxID=885957 RepID=A0A5K7ZPF6_9BACT|nr:glycosyltransferase family 2 protein [Desulfosarcina ovata]BBO82745.1 hypothetical protein DSCO28_33110 [Desulfosarcina ovata subsp. sediminis]
MISIITPVRNGEKHIETCVQNVIEQDCPTIEHIVVDGGSDDGTIEIVKIYAAKHNHLRYISENDNGQSNAMNKGIAMARGDIIGILNVDDFYEPDTLCRIEYLFRNKKKPAMIVGNCNVWDDSGSLLYVNRPERLRIEDLLLGWRVNPHPVNPTAYFYHKDLHKIIGPYDEDEHFAMDLDFIFRAVQKAHTTYFNEVWGNYRLIEGTKTVSDQKKGESALRAQRLRGKYQRQLPVFKQANVFLMKLKHDIFHKLNRLRIHK